MNIYLSHTFVFLCPNFFSRTLLCCLATLKFLDLYSCSGFLIKFIKSNKKNAIFPICVYLIQFLCHTSLFFYKLWLKESTLCSIVPVQLGVLLHHLLWNKKNPESKQKIGPEFSPKFLYFSFYYLPICLYGSVNIIIRRFSKCI